jgi:hypothetical protein
VRYLTVFDMAACLHDLKPADLPQGACRTADGVLYRVLDALLGRACDFDDSVNVVRHRHSPFGETGRPVGRHGRLPYGGTASHWFNARRDITDTSLGQWSEVPS